MVHTKFFVWENYPPFHCHLKINQQNIGSNVNALWQKRCHHQDKYVAEVPWHFKFYLLKTLFSHYVWSLKGFCEDLHKMWHGCYTFFNETLIE